VCGDIWISSWFNRVHYRRLRIKSVSHIQFITCLQFLILLAGKHRPNADPTARAHTFWHAPDSGQKYKVGHQPRVRSRKSGIPRLKPPSQEVNHVFLELLLGLTEVQTEGVNIRVTGVLLIISSCIAMATPINIFVSSNSLQRLMFINGVFIDAIRGRALISKPVCLQAPPLKSCFKQRCVR
jgi:hypothetical protein